MTNFSLHFSFDGFFNVNTLNMDKSKMFLFGKLITKQKKLRFSTNLKYVVCDSRSKFVFRKFENITEIGQIDGYQHLSFFHNLCKSTSPGLLKDRIDW